MGVYLLIFRRSVTLPSCTAQSQVTTVL